MGQFIKADAIKSQMDRLSGLTFADGKSRSRSVRMQGFQQVQYPVRHCLGGGSRVGAGWEGVLGWMTAEMLLTAQMEYSYLTES